MFITIAARDFCIFLDVSTFRQMKLMRLLFVLTIFLTSHSVISQDTIPYYINDVEYKIFNGMDAKIKSEFLNLINAKELEIAPFTDVDFPIRITREDGSQNLMRYGEVEFIHPKDLESIDFFTYTSREIGITFGNYKGQRKIIFTEGFIQKLNKKKNSWDEIIWRNEEIYEPVLPDSQNGQQFTEHSTMPEFYVKKDGLWGVIGIYEGIDIQIIVPPIYSKKESILLEYWPWNYTPDFEKIRKKYKADLIEPLGMMDNYYKVRSRKSKKWGVVQVHDNYELVVDTEQDSILSFEDQNLIVHWKDGYVNITENNSRVYYHDNYDDFEIINLDYMWGVALKSENKWALYSIEESKKLIEQSANTTEQLMEYWLNRNEH